MYMNYIYKSSLKTNGSHVVFDSAVRDVCLKDWVPERPKTRKAVDQKGR